MGISFRKLDKKKKADEDKKLQENVNAFLAAYDTLCKEHGLYFYVPPPQMMLRKLEDKPEEG